MIHRTIILLLVLTAAKLDARETIELVIVDSGRNTSWVRSFWDRLDGEDGFVHGFHAKGADGKPIGGVIPDTESYQQFVLPMTGNLFPAGEPRAVELLAKLLRQHVHTAIANDKRLFEIRLLQRTQFQGGDWKTHDTKQFGKIAYQAINQLVTYLEDDGALAAQGKADWEGEGLRVRITGAFADTGVDTFSEAMQFWQGYADRFRRADFIEGSRRPDQIARVARVLSPKRVRLFSCKEGRLDVEGVIEYRVEPVRGSEIDPQLSATPWLWPLVGTNPARVKRLVPAEVISDAIWPIVFRLPLRGWDPEFQKEEQDNEIALVDKGLIQPNVSSLIALKRPVGSEIRLEALAMSIDRFSSATRLLSKVADVPLPTEMMLSLRFAGPLMRDLGSARAGTFHPLTSQSLERVGEVGTHHLREVLATLEKSGKLPAGHLAKFTPFLAGAPDVIAAAASQIGRGDHTPTVREVTLIFDGLAKAAMASLGAVAAAPLGPIASARFASIASTATGLSIQDVRDMSYNEQAAFEPARQLMVSEYKTHLQAASAHGAKARTFSEMYTPQFVAQVGFSPTAVAEQDARAASSYPSPRPILFSKNRWGGGLHQERAHLSLIQDWCRDEPFVPRDSPEALRRDNGNLQIAPTFAPYRPIVDFGSGRTPDFDRAATLTAPSRQEAPGSFDQVRQFEAIARSGIGSIGQRPGVDGVWLQGAAAIEGGATITSGNLSLVFQSSSGVIDLDRLARFTTAAWAAYLSVSGPGLSIEPLNPQDAISKHEVIYIGQVEHTDLGRAMRETDYLMKLWASGQQRPVLEGYLSADEWLKILEKKANGRPSRFWLVPEGIKFKQEAGALVLSQGRMTVQTEYLEGPPEPVNEANEAFANWMTESYHRTIAPAYSTFADLFEYAKLTALATYLREERQPLLWFLLSNRELILTERRKVNYVDAVNRRSDTAMMVSIHGGVSNNMTMFIRNTNNFSGDAALQKTSALAFGSDGIMALATGPGQAQKDYTAAASRLLTLSGSSATGDIVQTDVTFWDEYKEENWHLVTPGLELLRYYNPDLETAAGFGGGWHLAIPFHLEVVRHDWVNGREVPAWIEVRNLISGETERLEQDPKQASRYLPKAGEGGLAVELLRHRDGSWLMKDLLGATLVFALDGKLKVLELRAQNRDNENIQTSKLNRSARQRDVPGYRVTYDYEERSFGGTSRTVLASIKQNARTATILWDEAAPEPQIRMVRVRNAEQRSRFVDVAYGYDAGKLSHVKIGQSSVDLLYAEDGMRVTALKSN